MFRIKTKVKLIKAVLSSFSTITEELILKISPDGLHAKAMDPSHWSMVNIFWRPEQFDEFSCDAEIIFGISTTDINAILKRFKEDDVEITIKDSLLNLESGSKSYQMRTIAADMMPEIPDELKVEATCIFESNMTRISESLEDVSVVNNMAKLITEDGKLYCTSSGDTAKVKTLLLDKTDGIANSEYSVDLFKGITSSLVGMSERVVVALGTKSPIRLQVFLTDKLMLTYYLAPRIGNDD